MILAYRTQNGKDDTAIKEIQSNPNVEEVIFSVWRDDKIKGYIFVETNSQENCYELLRGNRYLKGLVRGNVSSGELLKNINDIDNFEVKDNVIIRQGALKGEMGTIEEIRKDKIKVMLKSSSILIPILLNKEDIDLLDKKIKPIEIKEDFVSKKESGSKEKTECPHCKGELEYLYIQSKKMKEVFQGTGNSICNGEKRDMLIGDIMCPNEKCNKNLTLFWRNKFPGTMIKK